MKTVIRDTFDVSPETFWEKIFFDREYQERMYKEALDCASVQILESKSDGDRARRLVFAQRVDAPGPIRKLFGETTTMEERGKLDPQTKRWRFEMIPDRMPDKIRITGETWVEPAGAGIERVCALDFGVSIFGVGGLVEKFMVSQTSESYAKQTAFMRKYIAEKALK